MSNANRISDTCHTCCFVRHLHDLYQVINLDSDAPLLLRAWTATCNIQLHGRCRLLQPCFIVRLRLQLSANFVHLGQDNFWWTLQQHSHHVLHPCGVQHCHRYRNLHIAHSHAQIAASTEKAKVCTDGCFHDGRLVSKILGILLESC